jgi:hypothetical protein
MTPPTIAITETMEQLNALFLKYLALHREIQDPADIIHQAIAERFGAADPRDVLFRAEENSLAAARQKDINNPNKNKWVTTTAQGDLFNAVPVRIPSLLIVDGKPRPYYEVSVLDGLEWWRARQDAKAHDAGVLSESAQQRHREAVEAGDEAAKLEALIQIAVNSGMDPRTVRYAKTQAASE